MFVCLHRCRYIFAYVYVCVYVAVGRFCMCACVYVCAYVSGVDCMVHRLMLSFVGKKNLLIGEGEWGGAQLRMKEGSGTGLRRCGIHLN